MQVLRTDPCARKATLSLTHPEGRGRPPPVDGLRGEGRRRHHPRRIRRRRRDGGPHWRRLGRLGAVAVAVAVAAQLPHPRVGERREAVVHPLALVRVEQHLRRESWFQLRDPHSFLRSIKSFEEDPHACVG